MAKKQPNKAGNLNLTAGGVNYVDLPFDEAKAKARLQEYCQTAGLVWNEGNWQFVLPIIVAQQFTQEQAVEAVKAHITLVAHLFNPKAYPWRGRLLLAAHFLFNFKRK